MPARILPPTPENLALAAQVLKTGGLVAFPTETVYGLGANALSESAVRKIFEAKGRPATNPLIVHVASLDDAKRYAARWPDAAEALAQKRWPGPLTLVVEKTLEIPDVVTAGGLTVGLRVPAHPIARELIRLAGVPLAAPSANRSEEVSPTTAQHVVDSLGPCLNDLLILDGGPCEVGIESAVIDVTGDQPHVLRPGMLSPFPDRAPQPPVTGEFPGGSPITGGQGAGLDQGIISRSPGQMLRHYAPRRGVQLVPAGSPCELAIDCSPGVYAARLYAALRWLDDPATDGPIRVEEPPKSAEWDAIRDRLTRAAAKP